MRGERGVEEGERDEEKDGDEIRRTMGGRIGGARVRGEEREERDGGRKGEKR